MNRVAKRAAAVWLLTILLLAGFGFFLYEYVTQADQWAVFSGSPHVYFAGNMGTGAVTDREGILLLNMNRQRTYSSSENIRRSTVHWVGDRNGSISAPAVSHYSKQVVSFNLLNGLYRYGGAGGVAKLTLSTKAQIAALEALGDRKGTVAVYNYRTGELLCAVTSPNYDPDHIPDIAGDTTGKYEGVYMNRFTQAAYTPGSIFKIITLTAALDSLPEAENLTFTCTGTYSYGVDRITCESVHGQQSLKQAFCNSCNCAFAQLSGMLGADTLHAYVEKLQVTEPLSFDGITTVKGNFQKSNNAVELAWSAIGQYTDLINPCRFLTVMGVIANGGKAAIPYVVAQAGDGLQGYTAQTQYTEWLLDSETASLVQQYMRNNVVNKYGSNHFPGMTVCAKTGTAEMDGEKKSTAMFAGFVTDEAYPLAFIVCVEEGGYGSTTCIPIASKVLAVCKEVLDSE